MSNNLTAALMRLAAAFPREHIPDSTVVLYAGKLANLDHRIMVQVIERTIEQSRNWPSIAELREAYHRSAEINAPPALPQGGGIPIPPEVKAQVQAVKQRIKELGDEVQGIA